MFSALFEILYRRSLKGQFAHERALHMETRLHLTELEALDAFAHVLGVDRAAALREAVYRQGRKRQGSSPLPADLRVALSLSVAAPSAQALSDSFVVCDDYRDPELAALVEHYELVSGCRTHFAVPRHALCCELIERGLIPHVPAPVGFGDEAFV